MRTLRYRAVLFDAGETLIGPKESFGAVYARVLRTLGFDLPAQDLELGLRTCWANFNRTHVPGQDRYRLYPGGEHEYWLRFVEGTLKATPNAPNDRALAQKALEPLRDAFRDPEAWQVYDDVVPVLDELKALGVRLGVVSNWDSRLPTLLEALGLASRFDTVAVSHLEGIEKPHPELFLRALRRLGVAPEEALHVGDVPELDEAGAKAAGIDSVIVNRRASERRDTRVIPGMVRNEG